MMQIVDVDLLSCPPTPTDTRDCVRMRFFCCGVDVALM